MKTDSWTPSEFTTVINDMSAGRRPMSWPDLSDAWATDMRRAQNEAAALRATMRANVDLNRQVSALREQNALIQNTLTKAMQQLTNADATCAKLAADRDALAKLLIIAVEKLTDALETTGDHEPEWSKADREFCNVAKQALAAHGGKP